MDRQEDLLATFWRFREALLANDLETLDALLAPDYLGFDPGGRPQARAMTLEAFRPGMTRFTRYDVDELEVRLIGDAGLLVGLGTIEGAYGEWPFAHRLRFVDVYRATPEGSAPQPVHRDAAPGPTRGVTRGRRLEPLPGV